MIPCPRRTRNRMLMWGRSSFLLQGSRLIRQGDGFEGCVEEPDGMSCVCAFLDEWEGGVKWMDGGDVAIAYDAELNPKELVQ